MQEKRLSYQYSKWHLISNILATIFFCSVAWVRFSSRDFEFSLMSALVVVVVILFFILLTSSQLLYLCTAHVKQDRVIVKKLFKTEESFTFKQIVKVKKYRLSRTHYTMVTMCHTDGTMSKYMILNIYAWYAQSRYDAKEVLEELRSNNAV